MGKFVIDIFLNSIVYVEDNELLANNHHYKIISNIKLMNIEKKNYIKIKNIIKKNNVDGYYHLSMKPLLTLINTSQKGTTYSGNTNLYYHPVGLYVSCGIKYFREKSTHYLYIYELQFNESVLKIISLEGFIKFIIVSLF